MKINNKMAVTVKEHKIREYMSFPALKEQNAINFFNMFS